MGSAASGNKGHGNFRETRKLDGYDVTSRTRQDGKCREEL